MSCILSGQNISCQHIKLLTICHYRLGSIYEDACIYLCGDCVTKRLLMFFLCSKAQIAAKQDALVISDFDDSDIVDNGAKYLQSTLASCRIQAGAMLSGDTVSQVDMNNMNTLLWGASRNPPPSWKQGLFFCHKESLSYGLVQRKGGPCGVLAAIQAQLLASFWPNVSKKQ